MLFCWGETADLGTRARASKCTGFHTVRNHSLRREATGVRDAPRVFSSSPTSSLSHLERDHSPASDHLG